MPSVLTELGFISNSKDCAVLITRSGQEQFARRLFNAFVAYKKNYEGVAVVAPQKPAVKETPQKPAVKETLPQERALPEQKQPAETVVESVSGDFYAVQILSVAKQLKKGAYDLKGRDDAQFIKVGNLYKYYIGRYAQRKDAVKEMGQLRKKFPGAFVIHIKDNKIVK